MSTAPTYVGSDSRAYRRGIVLGLTMAEIMLLLVFCLLIAAAVVFMQDRKDREQLRAELDAREQRLAEAERLGAGFERQLQLLGRGDAEEVKANWRRLIEAEDAVRRLEAAGVPVGTLAEKADQVKPVAELIRQGVTGEEIARSLALDRRLAERGLPSADGDDVARWAAAGRDAERGGQGQHDWPPIIDLSEAKGYSFALARADLTPGFEQKLRSSVVEQVVDLVQRYKVDVVEVIGHTDEKPLAPRVSNLDQRLVGAVNGTVPIGNVVPADNAGLGMARAVSVAQVLRADPRLQGVAILPLSGAQMILPGDALSDGRSAGDAAARRRIEIRVRRSERAATN